MGQTTFSGPLRAGDKDVAAGQVVLQQQQVIGFADIEANTDTFQTDIVLPAGAHILEVFVENIAAFSGAATLEVGDGSDADAIADIAALNGATRIVGTFDQTQKTFCAPLASQVQITLTRTAAVTLTAGTMVFCVHYAQKVP